MIVKIQDCSALESAGDEGWVELLGWSSSGRAPCDAWVAMDVAMVREARKAAEEDLWGR